MSGERRIALVGPFPPVRGGIARHTGLIGKALSARSDISLRQWGFYRQYPPLLYPGAEERDTTSSASAQNVLETLSGTNPKTWQKTAGEIRKWDPTTLIIPAWTFFLAPALGWIAAANKQAETCMVVHNAFDHERAGWKDKVSGWQLNKADRFVTHNQALANQLGLHFPDKPIDVFPHPVFDDFPAATGTLPRRKPTELLFFGLVRSYKGLDILLSALSRVDREDIFLTIAGEFWGDIGETRDQLRRLALEDRVELIPRFVSDEEAAELFQRADAVVLPYRTVTGSGVVSNAYHYGRAVIASDLPGFSEIVTDKETGWLFKAGDSDDLARVIANLEPDELRAAGERAARLGRTLSWDKLVEVIVDRPSIKPSH